MRYAAVKEHAYELFNQAPFVSRISSDADEEHFKLLSHIVLADRRVSA